ncbi:MAG: copper homeostasis protein CutC [Bacteroidetes bacterium]|nr:copper homeostasis protein CutC [Bacteroidota bacterium]
MKKLEVIGFNIQSCIMAQRAGAYRIELCDSPGEGGTTPSAGLIREARKKLSIELFPIIRPRGGDFLYSDDEFEIMKTDVLLCKNAGCDGVVIGMLKADGSVDTHRCSQLVELAYPLGVTFHRAFDRSANAFEAMEHIISIGCERILTSGQRSSINEGAGLVAELVAKADNRIIIMPGSGVRADNIQWIAEKTKATEFHSSARKLISSNMTYRNEQFPEELNAVGVDEEEIRRMVGVLNGE